MLNHKHDTSSIPKQPKSILDLMERGLIENFLRGYVLKSLSGVSLYFKKSSCYGIPAGNRDIDEVFPTQAPEGDHDFCKYFQSIDDEKRNRCINFDKNIVLQYYRSKTTKERMVYPCHFGAIDMAHPLYVDGQLYGVLFCGQIILKDQQKDFDQLLNDELSEIKEYWTWDTIKPQPPFKNQRNFINDQIDNHPDLSENEKKTLKKNSETNNIHPDELVDRFNEFHQFSLLTQELLEELYESKQNAALVHERNEHTQFINDCLKELSETRYRNIVSWQSLLRKALSYIRKNYDIERIGIFHGQKEKKEDSAIHFHLVAMNSSRWWKTEPIKMRIDIFDTITGEYGFGELPVQLHAAVGNHFVQSKSFLVYSYKHEDTNVYTLAVIQNTSEILEQNKEYIEDIMNRIFRRDEIVRLNLRENEAYNGFAEWVKDIRHALQTSVQHIISNIDGYTIFLKQGMSVDDLKVIRQYDLIQSSKEQHTESIDKLTPEIESEIILPLDSIDLWHVIHRQVDIWQATAKEKGIEISLEPAVNKNPTFIVCEPGELNRAVDALLDNAIKYSYTGYKAGRIINVTYSVDKDDGQEIEEIVFSIQNYGIGIPEKKLEKIRKRGERAKVYDWKRARTGSGIGLYIAYSVFESMLDGKMQIESHKDPKIQKNIVPYHRYITTVTVTIPLEEGMHKGDHS